MSELTLSQTIQNVSISIFSSLVIIIDLCLLISVFRLPKTIYIVKILSIQLLLSSAFFSLHLALISLLTLGVSMNCDFYTIEHSFSGGPMVLSLLCITLNSYLILTNNYTFHRKKQMVLVILILLTWLPSIGLVVFYFIVRHPDSTQLNCFKVGGSYWKWVPVPTVSIEVIIIIVCVILLFKVCSLKVQNDKELQISKKKTISKIVTYIIMIFVGIILKSVALIFLVNTQIQNYFVLLLCAYFLVQNYVFVWNKQLKEALLNTFCCRSKEETEETMVKNNQKELAFKYEIADDISQQNFDEEEEPSDN